MKTKIFSFLFLFLLSNQGYAQTWLTNNPAWAYSSTGYPNRQFSCDNDESTESYTVDGGEIIYDLGAPYSISSFSMLASNVGVSKYLYCSTNLLGPWMLVVSGSHPTGGWYLWSSWSFEPITSRYWKFASGGWNHLREIGFYAFLKTTTASSDVLSTPYPFCPTLTAKSTMAPYHWSTGETTQKISASQTNNYVLNNTDTTGIFVSQSHNDSIYTPNGKVHTIYRKGDTVYMGGQFDYMARVTGNGAMFQLPRDANTTYMPRVNGTIDLVVSDGNGGWYVAGDFTKVGLDSVRYLAHIKNDKKLDTAFKPLPNGKIKSLVVAGTRLFVGGNFTKMGDVTRGYLVMLDKVSGMATSWTPAPNGPVNGILVFGDQLYAGGSFTSLGGQPRNYLGSVDTTFALASTWNPNPNATVNKLIPNAGKLYVTGNFSTISGLPRARLASYTLATGTLDTWSPNPDAVVHDLAFIGSDIFVCGGFHNIGGGVRNWLASVNNTNGNVTTWWPGVNDTVFAIGSIGNILFAGGRFTSINTSGTPVDRYKLCSFDLNPLPNPSWGQVTNWNPLLIGTYGRFAKVLSIDTYEIGRAHV